MKANGRAIAILLGWGGAVVAAASGAETEPPRLAVVISIDQCRADYLERFRPYFVEGGFRRLIEHGAYFRDAHHRHAMTATAPGHATIVTGVSARDHGIVANEWFDPAAGRVMGAVEDPTAPLVPEAPERTSMPGMPDAERSGSPRRLLAATIGDQLKLRHGATSRAISIANKDRAAVFLGGRSADAAYWIVNGRVVTSRFYRDALPEWLVRFNAEDRVFRAFGHTWDRLLERDVYDAVQGPDDTAGEESRHGLGTTFPRKVDGGRAVPDQEYFNAYRLAPHGSVVLEELARATIEHEQLGQREGATDLLCIGFSQTDYAGHSFGPDSHEIMDSVLRLDRALVSLLATLDREVGEGRYGVVLTADHGVAPLPERLPAQERGLAAGRLGRPELHRLAETALSDAFGPPPDGTAWSVLDGYGFRLVPR
ncbi:MAG TPA: alkaline phosphatase family protein, partial [Opitutus sp.]|nr:alkaline phosphatase family protein [Opitutus sp.]